MHQPRHGAPAGLPEALGIRPFAKSWPKCGTRSDKDSNGSAPGFWRRPTSFTSTSGCISDTRVAARFVEEASILVKPDKLREHYTVWINGERFHAPGTGTSRAIAETLKEAIKKAPFGSIEAFVEQKTLPHDMPGVIVHKNDEAAVTMVASANLQTLDALETAERHHPRIPDGRDVVLKAIQTRRLQLKTKESAKTFDPDAEFLVRVRSTVLPETALVFLTGANAGSYELNIDGKPFRYAVTPTTNGGDRRQEIRNGLFEEVVRDLNLRVTAAVSGDTGLLLQPKGGEPLPRIKVRNDHQNLSVVYGPTLHIRLEQCHNQLSFDTLEKATIGYNEAPFLINVPGQWEHRPGALAAAAMNIPGMDPDHGQQEPVFYRISNRRWVAAGTFMATTTRLTTMEAANESARHAVNSILHRLVVGPGSDYNAQGRMFADWAEIWDPERTSWTT